MKTLDSDLDIAKGKEGLKKAFYGVSNKLIKIIFGGLSTKTLAILAIVLLILFVPCMIISALPIGDIFQTNESIQKTEDELTNALSYAYASAYKNSADQVISYVNSKYGCNAKKSDVSVSDRKITIDTDTCLISALFSPSLFEMKENISAYVNAVNGTIAFLGEETNNEIKSFYDGTHQKLETFQGQIFEQKEGKYNLTKDAWDFYISHSDELTNTSDASYIDTIKAQSGSFFVYDDNEIRWDNNGFYQGPKTHKEYQVVDYDEETGAPVYGWVDVTLTAWYGNIGILMFYDLSDFKKDELDKCVDLLANSKMQAIDDSMSTVGNVLHEYYDNYIGHFNGHYENGTFILGRDNRNELFSKLIEDGTLIYVPISGLTASFLEGQAGYCGDAKFSAYDDMSSRAIWQHIQTLRNSGVIGFGTAMWNCTAFAQSWFYELYGVNALYGNGRDMVSNLLNPKNALVGDWGSIHFYRGSSPAPGGIYSIGSPAGGNHVGCVDSVDYENKTITFSDGNTNSAGNSNATISIKRTLSFDAFESYVKSCCKVHGSTSGCWVTYANPKKESF